MGAFLGCLAVAVMIFFCVGWGIEPGIVKIANELERIADALQDEEIDDDPGNSDDHVAT